MYVFERERERERERELTMLFQRERERQTDRQRELTMLFQREAAKALWPFVFIWKQSGAKKPMSKSPFSFCINEHNKLTYTQPTLAGNICNMLI